MTLSHYVEEQIALLIDGVSEAAARAEYDTSAEGIHKLRVSIRKLSEGLRVFKDLFPHGASKKVRKELKAAMKPAGDARNHDIARGLMKKAKLAADPAIGQERERAAQTVSNILHEWNRSKAWLAWKERLHGEHA